MLRKELLELLKTGRLLIVTGVMVSFGILGPAAARYLPQLMEGQLPEGMQIIMPEPVPADGVQQFLENVGQLGWIALILVTMGALAGERAAGTVAVVLATPVSRSSFVVAKLISRLLLLLVSVVAGAAVCILYTGLLLGAYPLPEFLAATGLYVLYGALVVAWTILMSSLVRSGIGAGGLALVPLFLIPTLSLLSGRVGDFLPFGLIIAAGDIVRLRAPVGGLGIAVAVTLALIAACALAAHARIRTISF
jgi:ABC-2 type transport system permease protein